MIKTHDTCDLVCSWCQNYVRAPIAAATLEFVDASWRVVWVCTIVTNTINFIQIGYVSIWNVVTIDYYVFLITIKLMLLLNSTWLSRRCCCDRERWNWVTPENIKSEKKEIFVIEMMLKTRFLFSQCCSCWLY